MQKVGKTYFLLSKVSAPVEGDVIPHSRNARLWLLQISSNVYLTFLGQISNSGIIVQK